MNSVKNEAEKLPDGWILCQSKSNPGRKYYFNKKTGKSSWTTPQVEENHEGKQKSKKERVKEKSKKEEQRKNLKRRSDGSDESFSRKKQKQDPPTPEKQKLLPSKTESPTKTPNSSKKESPSKILINPSPAKNLANTRLSLLRAQLNTEIQALSNDETESSPSKLNKIKISPKALQTPKVDLKSPNMVDTRYSLTHSPSSDSVQSVPSPSQFLAATKIISSMKAQLPDEYCNKLKPKDTFADIEQGICSQTAEYPSMKHPATPPQFSEASKLVSAIKSRLSYKVATKDVDIKSFSSAKDVNVKGFASAKDRMEALRSRLSNEVDTMDDDSSFVSEKIDSNFVSEAMEVEDCKEVKTDAPSLHCTKDVGSKDNVILVVDTNVFIRELDIIKNVINSHIKGYAEQPTLLVPWRVVNELDRLKDNNNGNGAICKRARAAMDYLYKSLPENNRIKGQSLRDANSHIYPCESPDDEILNCCLQQADRGISVVLLSNDKNLCNKALLNGVKCITLSELNSLIEHKPQPTVDPDLYTSVKHYEDTMYQLLANILENEMRAKYNNLWQHVVFKAPPWTLADTLLCLLKHWVAVFSEVFPRIEHLITDLKNAQVAIQKKGPQTLTQSEVANFKELCMDVAKKCQIIPEYMELAKVTVERLAHADVSRTDSERQGSASETESKPVETPASELPVIEAFEGLWTVFSSYCAKLSNALGVAHNVEDKQPGQESWTSLTGKWITFNKYINTLADTMRGALCIDVMDPDMEEQVLVLETVFKESLAAVSLDGSAVNRDSMRIFCTNCRNMLEEAYTKFSELSEILTACQNNMANK